MQVINGCYGVIPFILPFARSSRIMKIPFGLVRDCLPRRCLEDIDGWQSIVYASATMDKSPGLVAMLRSPPACACPPSERPFIAVEQNAANSSGKNAAVWINYSRSMEGKGLAGQAC